MGQINTAIVGYGYAGRVMHAQLVKAADGLDLMTVSTRDAERRAAAERDFGVRTCASVDELVADDDVQLVVIATPHDTHRDIAVRCLDAGKHVVTDKLMCMNAGEADEMIAAARRNDRMLSVFHNRRWDCGYLTLKKALADGLLGDLVVVEAAVVNWGHPKPTRWRSFRKHGGGQFRDWGAHLTDQALQLVDAPVASVWCDMLYGEPSVDVETAALCNIVFANGVRYRVETGSISALVRPRWYVRGTKGALRKTGLDPQENALREGRVDPACPQPEADRAAVRYETDDSMREAKLETVPGTWTSYYQNVADHLLKGADLAVKPEQVRRAMAVIDAAAKSAETGTVVTCEI